MGIYSSAGQTYEPEDIGSLMSYREAENGQTAGRTTLGGEGLQHQDGFSPVHAASVPNCRVYDPCFAGELAVILDHGMRRMLEAQEDEFYYLTLMNENYAQPTLPAGAQADIVKGMYRFSVHRSQRSCGSVRLVGSSALLREAIAAADLWTGGRSCWQR